MVVVDNVKDFAKYNEEDIRRFLTSSRGKKLFDLDMVNDIIQSFYVRLINSGALSKFNPELASFDTYIITILCNMLPQERRKNTFIRYRHVSVIPNPSRGNSGTDDNVDIFDHLHGNSRNPNLHIERKNVPSSIFREEEDECVNHIRAFIQFIKESEPNKRKARKMVCFLENKLEGCLATEIAMILGVSDNMVKIIKNNIYNKYKKWDSSKKKIW